MDQDDQPNHSEFSSSESHTSQRSVVTEDTLRLGTDPIWRLIAYRFGPSLMSNFLMFFCRFVEIRIVIIFMGFQELSQLIPFMLLRQLLSRDLFQALSEGTSISVEKRLANNQILISNTYISHFVLTGFIFAVIILILYFAAIKSMSGNEYLLIALCVDPFLQIFNLGAECFLKVESRLFLVFTKEILVELSAIMFMNFALLREQDKPELRYIAISNSISAGIGFIWYFIALSRLFDDEFHYKGCLKFAFAHLSPLRIKMIYTILINSISQILSLFSDDILYLASALCCFSFVKLEEVKQLQFLKLAMFWISRSMAVVPSNAISQIFGKLASYNIGIKKVTRVFESFNLCLALMVIFVLITPSIIIGVMPQIVGLFRPKITDIYQEQMLIDVVSAGRYGAGCAYFTCAYKLIVALLQAEEHYFGSILLQMPMLILSLIYIITNFIYSGDGAKPYLSVFYSDLFNGIGGLIIDAYYIFKYKRLSKLNKVKPITEQTVYDDKLVKIRFSVAAELNYPHNEKQYEQEQLKSRINNMFDKHVALKQSKIFANVRDTMNESNRNSATSNALKSASNLSMTRSNMNPIQQRQKPPTRSSFASNKQSGDPLANKSSDSANLQSSSVVVKGDI